MLVMDCVSRHIFEQCNQANAINTTGYEVLSVVRIIEVT